MDITHGGLPALAQQLSRRREDNNNWVLNACIEGRPLGKLSERAEVLLRYADSIHDKRPQALTAGELAQIRSELTSRWIAILSSRERARVSAKHRLICRIRSDQLAVRMVYIRYLLDRKWTTSIIPLLVRCEREYPDLVAALTSYSSAYEIEEGTRYLESAFTNLVEEVDLKLEGGGSR